MDLFGIVRKKYYLCSEKKQMSMFNIYEKDLNTNKVKFFVKVSGKKEAEYRVKELNALSMYEDKFYFFKEEGGING